MSVPGTDAYWRLPAGQLAIGQGFQYQIADCDSGGCATSAITTGSVSPLLGAGPRPGATRLPFPVGEGLTAQVDVGSGNLLLSTTQFAVPRRDGSTLDIGAVYNSAALNAGGGSFSSGWRLSTGTDVRMEMAGNGDVVYYGPGGVTGTFVPDGAGGYVSPPGMKVTLTPGNGWTLSDHASGQVLRFAQGWLLTSIKDRNGNTATFTHVSDGYANDKLTTITTDVGPGTARTLSVATTGNVPPRITGITQDPQAGSGLAARSVSYGYNGAGQLTSITDLSGHVTGLGYDGTGRLASITAPGGAVTTVTYDSTGRVTTLTQPTGTTGTSAVTRLAYDATHTYLADPDSNQSQAVMTAAHTTYTLTGDGLQLIAAATDPTGAARSATYTPMLDVATATDPAGTTTFDHPGTVNGGESLTGVHAPTGAAASMAYGNTGAAAYSPATSTDPQHNTASYTYNGAGNRLSAVDGSTNAAAVTANTDGTVATSTSPAGAVTSYSYDTNQQLATVTPPIGTSLSARSYTYDGFGRLATATDGRGITQTYGYDTADRLTSVTYSDASPSVTYTYDSAGRLDSRVDASGTTTFGYDPLGRLTTRTNTAGGGTLSYSYDKAGNLVTDTNIAGTTTYSYDTRNVVTAAVADDGKRISFATDPAGRRTDTWFNANTTHTSWAAHTHTDFDASGRITRIWTAQASTDSNRISDLSYTYTSPGTAGCATAPPAGTDTSLRWTDTDNLGGQTTAYCYDHSNRRTSHITTPGGVPLGFTFDADGNTTKVTKNGATADSWTFNAADQIARSDYGYDAAGNTTQTSWGGGTALTYNGAGQMTASSADTYTYDTAMTYAGTDQTELITQAATGKATRTYAYGRTNANGLPIIESYTQSAKNYSYVYDPQGTPLALRSATGSTHYLALDGLGSTIALTNDTGDTTGTYDYYYNGQAIITAANASTATAYQIYTYAGGVKDLGTDYISHFGARWYDAYTGVFTQPDPITTLTDPARANPYQYAGSNPVNYVDPTGQWWWNPRVTFDCAWSYGFVMLATGGLIAATFASSGAFAFAAVGYVGGLVSTIRSCK